VVFGAGTGQHVVMLMTGGVHGGDPWVASHGQESDPSMYRLSTEKSYFAGDPTVRYMQVIPGNKL